MRLTKKQHQEFHHEKKNASIDSQRYQSYVREKLRNTNAPSNHLQVVSPGDTTPTNNGIKETAGFQNKNPKEDFWTSKGRRKVQWRIRKNNIKEIFIKSYQTQSENHCGLDTRGEARTNIYT